jgi:hypothetical protein
VTGCFGKFCEWKVEILLHASGTCSLFYFLPFYRVGFDLNFCVDCNRDLWGKLLGGKWKLTVGEWVGKFSGWAVEILLHASHSVMFFLFRFNLLVLLLPLSSFSQLIRSGLVGGATLL